MGPTYTHVCRALVLAFSMLFLAACGGSGSSGGTPAVPAPTANAGADQTVNEQVMVTLDASSSANVQSYSWSQTAGTTVTLSDTAVAGPTFTAPTTTANETLTFTLTITGVDGTTVTDDVTINITDIPDPTADAGPDQTVNEQVMVTLDGSGSTNVGSYSWSQLSGTTVTLSDTAVASPTFTAPTTTANEVLTFRLTINGLQGSVVTDDVTINITDIPPPVANAGPDQTVNEQVLVTLDGSASTNVGSYSWSQISGPSVTLSDDSVASPTFTAPITTANQALVFRLTINGLEGSMSTDDVTINVTNIIPSPGNLMATPLVGGLRITWSNFGEAASYNIYHGPNTGLSIGGVGTTKITNVTTPHDLMGLTAGVNHTVSVTAVDANGNESALAPEVTAAPLVPTANAGPDQTVDEQTSVTLDGTGSIDAQSYFWFQSNGPGVVLNDNTLAQPSFTAPALTADAEIEFTLRITSSSGTMPTDTVTISVTNLVLTPGNLRAIPQDQQLAVFWDSVAEAVSYNLYHSASTGITIGGSGVTKVTGASIGHVITGLTNGVNHSMRVTAVDTDGNESPLSTEFTIAPANPLAEAGDDQTVNEQTSVRLDGTASVAAASYSWSQTSGTTVTLTNDAIASPLFTAPAVTADEDLIFELTVTGATGATSTDTVTISVTNVVPAPTNVAAAAGDKQLTVTWDPVAEATSYNLYHGPNQGLMIGAAGTTEVTGVTSGYVLGGLTNGVAHTVAVTAVNAGGLESVLSAEVTLAAAVTAPESVICSGNLDKTYTISNFAGNGSAGFSGMGGPATSASIGSLRGLSTDTDENIYALDNSQGRLYKIATATGVITSIAGGGATPGNGGQATSALLSDPWGLSLDGDDNIYIGEAGSDTVRQIDAASGIINVFAGNGLSGNSGDGGLATFARLADPRNIRFDLDGNLYIADWDNHAIRRVDGGTRVITTFAGTNGSAGSSGDGGAATSARLDNPFGMAFDSNEDLFIGDVNNAIVRKVDTSTGLISTVAGTSGSTGSSGDGGPATSATFNFFITDIMTDSVGNIIIADTFNHAIRLIEAGSGNIKTIAGTIGVDGSTGDGGPATSARFDAPYALTCADGKIYVADSNNFKIRVLTPN